MITYELAKKLKDAGFPQKLNKGIGISSKIFNEFGTKVYSEEVYFPTFSELIEECGDKFNTLFKSEDGLWSAGVFGYPNSYGKGLTPEEALANLYLK